MLTATSLLGVPHAFSTRTPLDPGDVLAGAPMVLAKQVHSPDVLVVDAPWAGEPPEADALVTNRRGLLVGIVTADCGPVLLADREAVVVAAAHAGWRGAAGGVLENTLDAMESLGARRERIVAAIGPMIAQASYEVDDALRAQFPESARGFFALGTADHWQFDLPGYIVDRLRRAGVTSIEDLCEDTYAQPGRFFSFRRATHRGEPTGGRQTSVIGLS